MRKLKTKLFAAGINADQVQNHFSILNPITVLTSDYPYFETHCIYSNLAKFSMRSNVSVYFVLGQNLAFGFQPYWSINIRLAPPQTIQSF